MVKLHHATPPRATVIKPAKRRRKPPAVKASCVVCGAHLRADHAAELVCDCHPKSGFYPCQVPHDVLDVLVFTYLLRAGGRTVNLYRALGCESTWENRAAIHRSVQRLKRMAVEGVKGNGYKLVTTAGEDAGRVEA